MALCSIFRRTKSQFYMTSFLLSSPSNQAGYFTVAFFRAYNIYTPPAILRKSFSSLQSSYSHNLYEPISFDEYVDKSREQNQLGFREFVEFLRNAKLSPFDGEEEEEEEVEAMAILDKSGFKPDGDLVRLAIWALKNEWKLASLVFKWGEKWGCNDNKTWNLMIWILGNHRRFSTAWFLIKDLYLSSKGTREAMLIMMDRYAAANEPSKAIRTFQMMEKFKLTPDPEAFYALLSTLCKHGNIEEAEEFMLLNKKLFPLEVEGFNLILGGWCNICVDVFEAKRIWREMSKCCIVPNASSYTHMISCFSVIGNLFDSLRLYDEMNKRGWVPGLEVYNSLVYVLTHENCLNEALRIVDKMKDDGLQPDSATYNNMIRPLCEMRKMEEAKTILATMISDNISPTTETYHSFLDGVSLEEALEVLDRMRRATLGPSRGTFLLLLGKFFKLEQPENALKIWVEMKQYAIVPDSALYILLVEGLVRCGLLDKAKEFYAEMECNGISDDPKLKKLLKEPLKDRPDNEISEGRGKTAGHMKTTSMRHQRKSFSMGRRKQGKQPRKKKSSILESLCSNG